MRWTSRSYTWALCLLGGAKLESLEDAVLECFYLHLSPTHVALIEKKFGKVTKSVQASKVPVHTSPPPAADVQSYVRWEDVAAYVGIPGRHRGSVAKRVWLDARSKVQEVLEVRGLLEKGAEHE